MFGYSASPGIANYAIVDNLAGTTYAANSSSPMPFDNVRVASTGFTLSVDGTRLHFGPGAYIITADAFTDLPTATSGTLALYMTYGSTDIDAVELSQGGIVPSASSDTGPIGLGFIATKGDDNWVSLVVAQTNGASQLIRGNLLIARIGSA